MFRFALSNLSKSAAAAAGGATRHARSRPLLPPVLALCRPYYAASDPRDLNPVALQTINYALDLARSQRSDESYAEALVMLEQCLGSQSQQGYDQALENSKGTVLLAVSTLLSERGSTDEAIQTLLRVQDLGGSSLGVRVAAMEALVGLHLELGLDDTSSVVADNCLKLLEKGQEIRDAYEYKVLNSRGKAIKGLVGLVQGDTDSARTFFQEHEDDVWTGNSALSCGEFLHAKHDFSAAKEFYLRAIDKSSKKNDFSDPYSVAACNMASHEVALAATCALGQLESHLGNFGDAEGMLTKALKQAEENFGSDHPRVGVVLTCIALMYRRKAVSERSSSLIIQEGLYRKALDLLKAPPLQNDGVNATESVDKRDILALARGGYAETLSVQENRKPEVEGMKSWADSAWKNRRLSLAQALDITSDPSSKVPIIDARICRVL